MLIGVISDTHIPGRKRFLPSEVLRAFEGVDVIMHAGDILIPEVLVELGAVAEVVAVLGNCDPPIEGLEETAILETESIKIGMIHDSGLREGRSARMRKRFPDCRVVVFGHSHQPVIEDNDGLLLLNPGSACDPRRAKIPTVALLHVDGDRIGAELVALA